MKRILGVALLIAALTGPAAAQEVSALATAGTPFSGSDILYLVQGGASKKTTMTLLAQQVALQISANAGITQLTGDCAAGPAVGSTSITCTKTGGTAFGALATLTPGTGVATALGVNVGSAGAVLVNGGALGTPSSGVATNLTGTAAGLTAGTVTTNANLTGPVTSTGNATAIANAAIGLAKIGGEVDGDCIVGAGGVWTAASCSAGGTVSVTAGTSDIVITPDPGLSTFTVGSTLTQNAPADGGSHAYTVVAGDITKEIALVSTFTSLVVPRAITTFAAGTQFYVCNSGSVTATTTTSTINGIAGATGLKLPPLSCSKWISSSGQWIVQMGLPTDPTQRSTYYLAGDNQFRDTAAITGLPNAALTNSSVTINTHSLALGGALTLAFSDFAGTVAAGQLPNPSASTLGGVQSKAAVSSQWINSISTSGVPGTTQPACADLSTATAYCSAAIGQLPGTTTNDTATAGNIGEGVFVSLAKGSATSLTTGTPVNLITQSFSAGDWEVWGTVCFTGNVATTVSYFAGAITTVSATPPTPPGTVGTSGSVITKGGATVFFYNSDECFAIGSTRILIAGSTPVYLVGLGNFATNTASAYGAIHGRRVR